MLQTLLWSRMACSSTFLKYPLAVLAQTPAALTFWCITMHFQRLLPLFLASNSGNRYWDWTLPSIRAQIELSTTFVYDYKMSTSGSSAKNSHLNQVGRMTMMPMPVNRITLECKIILSGKYCQRINLQLWNVCHSFLQWMGSFFLIIIFCSPIHVYRSVRRHGHQCHSPANSPPPPFPLPGWGANSSMSCRSCSFSGRKQRCWTVLSELRYKLAYNANTFFLNWKQRSTSKCM